MTKTRGPTIFGTLMVDDIKEEEIAWSWAKREIRARYPRCHFKQNRHGVTAFKKGEWVGLFLFEEEGSEVSL